MNCENSAEPRSAYTEEDAAMSGADISAGTAKTLQQGMSALPWQAV
jgi:hypothetical protein